MIIAIDGPAGSGKSTTARAVAERLGYVYVDTGAMYRTVALAFILNKMPPDRASTEEIRELLASMRLEMRFGRDGMQILLDGQDVTGEIRTRLVTEVASRVAVIPEVRERMVEEQRDLARIQQKERGGVVFEGRDIGTIVFPDADVKVFMKASVELRAQRRYEELQEQEKDDSNVSFEDVLFDIRARDERDISRQLSPLRKAEGTIEIDTSDIDVREQVEMVIQEVQAVRERRNRTSV
ncbi:MAG: (d)CMP kinase [Bacteroidetes bacterium SB0662_bin_6]|nr:(d)CMP kinase [Bacteroidetes bacterium SB0668_bin_1]MYE03478.1 (d)CMP kinase [Bacteroidetes bacterium SB0662_bin_6]